MESTRRTGEHDCHAPARSLPHEAINAGMANGGPAGNDGENGSVANGFLIHMLFDGDFGQRPSIVALVAANPPFFDPPILHIRLPALRTDEHAFFVEDPPLLFHDTPVLDSVSVSKDCEKASHRIRREFKSRDGSSWTGNAWESRQQANRIV